LDRQSEDGAESSRVTPILRRLQEGTAEATADGRARLRDLGKTGLTIDEGLEALQAAASGQVTADYDLVRVALAHPRFAYLSQLVERFGSFSPSVQSFVLGQIGTWPEAQAAEAYRDIVVRYAGSAALTSLQSGGFEREPRHPDILFPAILAAAEYPSLAADLYVLTQSYLAADVLSPALRQEITRHALLAFDKERVWLTQSSPEPGVAEKWRETYQEHRRLTIALLNLFAVPSVGEVLPVLTEALAFRDAVLVDTALHALARRGLDLPGDAIAKVAADPETRAPLYKLLKMRGELERMPARFRTQAALAESAMVIWLCDGTELGAAPDEIELMEVVSAVATLPDGATDDLDYYVFRFRTLAPHPVADEGWMAGLAGPYLRRATPTTNSQGPTFSAFHAWEEKTAFEHAVEMVEILDSWRSASRRK
jgi:hypothetical protein